jgi:hypothetical protein
LDLWEGDLYVLLLHDYAVCFFFNVLVIEFVHVGSEGKDLWLLLILIYVRRRGRPYQSVESGIELPWDMSPMQEQHFKNTLETLPADLPFDANDPVAAMMSMQAMGFPAFPGMPSLPQASSPNGQTPFGDQFSPTLRTQGRGEPCRDYETRGYCAKGDACPFEHGNDRLVVPGQDGRS